MTRRLAGDWLSAPGLAAVFSAIEGGGYVAYLVGGCVRDGLAGTPVGDVDIATNARPERVMALAEAAGLVARPTGIDHGTVTVISDDTAYEVTTFRRDVETDGRRAVVAFADDIRYDAQRRDFTMNALYADRTGRVIDPTGQGVDDLTAGRVRFVGEARARIREDYLRILRYFRFLARFGSDGPDPDTLAEIARHLDGIDTLSGERLGHEMRKLLAASDPAPSLATMESVGVLARILPGASASACAQLVYSECTLGAAPDWRRRLVAVGGENPTDRLRLSRAEARHLADLRHAAEGSAGPAELGYRWGRTLAVDALLLRGGPVSPSDLRSIDEGAHATFPISARDLMPELDGPALGARLRALENRWIASGFTLDKSTLLAD